MVDSMSYAWMNEALAEYSVRKYYADIAHLKKTVEQVCILNGRSDILGKDPLEFDGMKLKLQEGQSNIDALIAIEKTLWFENWANVCRLTTL